METYKIKADKHREQLLYFEKCLVKLMKENRADLFPGTDDRVEMKHGALIYTVSNRVKRAKKMLDKLERLKRSDLIKIAKSVDWDSIEKMSDDDLAAIGAERVRKENFEYEAKKLTQSRESAKGKKYEGNCRKENPKKSIWR